MCVGEIDRPDTCSGCYVEDSSGESVGQRRVEEFVVHSAENEMVVNVQALELGFIGGERVPAFFVGVVFAPKPFWISVDG